MALQPDDVISRRATPARAESDRGFSRANGAMTVPLTSAPSLSFAAARSDALAARRLSRVVRPLGSSNLDNSRRRRARVVASAAWGAPRRAGVTTTSPLETGRARPSAATPGAIANPAPEPPSESVSLDPADGPSETLDDSPPPSRTVVVGGGPTGLATAIMLARRGWRNIEVWERLPRPPNPDDAVVWGDPARSYNVGVSGRGQIALEKLGCCDRVLTYCKRVNGRMDWSPGKPEPVQRISDKRYATQVIQRDRLVAALLEEIEEMYADAVVVEHETACADVAWLPGGGATLTREPTCVRTEDGAGDGAEEDADPACDGVRVVEMSVPFVVGAEGATRRNAVMRAMETDPKSRFRAVRYEDNNPRVYKTIPIHLPEPEFRSDLNYSARTKAGVALECLPTKEGMLVGILLVKPGDAETCAKLESAESLRAYFDEDFPMFSPYVSDEDLAAMAARPLAKLPTSAHAGGGDVHRVDTMGANTAGSADEVGGACLLGDSIHTVKPYFGLGVNSAFEDVTLLEECLDAAAGESWTTALAEFSERRAEDAEALVRISRGFDGGFLTFVLPLILDGIFHRAFPKVFMPNTIQMLQKEDWTFSRVARRKRAERVAQVGILSAALGALGWVAFLALKAGVGMVMRAMAGARRAR